MEKRIRSSVFFALAMLFASSMISAEPQHSGHKQPFGDLVAIQKALAADSLDHVSHHAEAIAKAVKDHQLHGLPAGVASQATEVASSKDLKSARRSFKKLSQSFVDYLRSHPDQKGKYKIAYCPMAKSSWIQEGEKIQNPYFGKAMLNCGTFKKN